MGRTHRWLAVVGIVVLASISRVASAEPVTRDVVSVHVEADTDVDALVHVFPQDADPNRTVPLESCRLSWCELELRPGRYVFRVKETSDTLGGDREVSIDGPSKVRFSLSRRSTRGTGLALGIAGVTSIAIGSGAYLMSVGSAHGEGLGAGGFGAILLFVAGVALTPIGFVMYGNTFKPGIDVEPQGSATTRRSRLGVVALPAGAGLGGSFVF